MGVNSLPKTAVPKTKTVADVYAPWLGFRVRVVGYRNDRLV